MAFPQRQRGVMLAAAAATTLVVGLLGGLRPASAATGAGSPSDPNVTFIGRWDTSNPAAYVPKWAGAYVKVGFTGRTVQLKQRNTIDLFASVDGGPDKPFTGVKGTVNLTPTPLAAGNHTLRVSYRPVAGSYHGDAVYQGLVLDSGAHTIKAAVSPKIIEFVGDSITVGQHTARQAPDAYGWLVGDQLGVEHTQIAQGGACLVATSDGCVGLSVQFLKTGAEPTSPDWDFSRYRAAAVVINLGTNDVGHGVHTPEFESTYVTLLERVRAKYPNAVIFAMETFRKRFVTQTQNAVTTRNNAGDKNVYFVNTEGWIDEATDTVDNVHPNEAGHRKIANRLAPIIQARLGGTPTVPPTTAPTTASSTTAPATRPATSAPATSAPATMPPATVPVTTRPPTSAPVTTAPATTRPPASPCSVSYAVTNRWADGFQADLTLRNTGTGAITGWSLRWVFPGGEQVSQAWNATVSQSGATATATAASWNATIAAGGSASFGVLGTGSATANPTTFTLNGSTCAVA